MMRRLFLLLGIVVVATPWASTHAQHYESTPPRLPFSDAGPLYRLPAVDSLQPFQTYKEHCNQLRREDAAVAAR